MEQGEHAGEMAEEEGEEPEEKQNKKTTSSLPPPQPSSVPSELGFPSKYENSFTQRGNRCPWLEFACGFILF